MFLNFANALVHLVFIRLRIHVSSKQSKNTSLKCIIFLLYNKGKRGIFKSVILNTKQARKIWLAQAQLTLNVSFYFRPKNAEAE